MTVEVATRISELVASNPAGSDPKSEGDNHLRLIKGVLQDVFDDSVDGAITFSEANTTIAYDAIAGTLTISFADSGGTEIGSIVIDADGIQLPPETAIDAPIRNSLKVIDAASKIRAIFQSDETAGIGKLTITAQDDASTPDVKGRLVLDLNGLNVSPDDQTKILQFDQSRQATATTAKIYVPATAIDSVTGIYEPIARYDLAGKSEQIFRDLAAFTVLRMRLQLVQSASGVNFMLVSSDNGATFPNPASSYAGSSLVQNGTTVVGQAFNTTLTSSTLTISPTDAGATIPLAGETNINNFNTAGVLSFFRHEYLVVVAGVPRREWLYGYRNSPSAWNALKLAVNAGTWVSGLAILEGIRS